MGDQKPLGGDEGMCRVEIDNSLKRVLQLPVDCGSLWNCKNYTA